MSESYRRLELVVSGLPISARGSARSPSPNPDHDPVEEEETTVNGKRNGGELIGQTEERKERKEGLRGRG